MVSKQMWRWVFVCLFLQGCFAADGMKGALKDENVQLLFVLHAAGGKVEKNQSSSDSAILTLYGTAPSVEYFSDRPNRVAGKVKLAEFFKVWGKGGDSFMKDHPNADLVIPDSEKSIVQVPVILQKPQLDQKNDLLKFQINALPGGTIETKEFGETLLFIDDLSTTEMYSLMM